MRKSADSQFRLTRSCSIHVPDRKKLYRFYRNSIPTETSFQSEYPAVFEKSLIIYTNYLKANHCDHEEARGELQKQRIVEYILEEPDKSVDMKELFIHHNPAELTKKKIALVYRYFFPK